jgi:hypothetical protein
MTLASIEAFAPTLEPRGTRLRWSDISRKLHRLNATMDVQQCHA